MLSSEVQVGWRMLSKRWTYGCTVKVTKLIRNPEGHVTGFDYEYEETFARHFRPPSRGTWAYLEMLHWEVVERAVPQKEMDL